jgi:hypothetical protein
MLSSGINELISDTWFPQSGQARMDDEGIGMTSQEDIIRRTAEHIRTYGAVVIIGAGASYYMGLPIIRQLPDLLWDALQSDPDIIASLKKEHGWAGSSGKQVIGDDDERVRVAFRAIAKSEVARRTFQHEFAQLNKRHLDQKSPTHSALAELLHRDYVETVISMNWDTLLETAFADRYGRVIHAGGSLIHKPHGDATDPDSKWILPFEDEDNMELIEQITAHLDSLVSQHPRVLLVIGYSESDEVIFDQIIKPLVSRWRVVRVGPTPRPNDEIRITMPAEQAIPQLTTYMNLPEEVPGWEYVSFANQHDLAYVLSNQPLGPSEVNACPELLEASAVIKELHNSNLAPISGKSGSGKTITTYQVAHKLSLEGFEILRLTEGERTHAANYSQIDIENHIKVLSGLRFPTIVIIDDAQNIDRQFIRRVREIVTPKLKAILVYNDDEYIPGNTVHIDSKAAVATIADALRARRDETIIAVHALDESIGEGRLDISIERRIEEALESCQNSEDTGPWHFMAILTGIENRAKNQITYLRSKNRADLLLAAIAVGQIVTRDSGASVEWLEKAVKALGRDASWIAHSLRELRTMRLVLGTERLRCPHLRFAGTAVTIVCKGSAGKDREALVKMLRAALLDSKSSLQGNTWLLNEIKHVDGTGPPGPEPVIDDATWEALTSRCWAASGQEARREASLLLSALLDWRPQKQMLAISDHAELLGRWLDEADTTAIAGISSVIHALRQSGHLLPEAPAVAEKICSYADPDVIAEKFAKIKWIDASVWGWALSDITASSCDDWKKRLAARIDRAALQRLVESATHSTLYPLNYLTGAMWSLDEWLGVDVVYWATPIVVQALNHDPLGAFEQIWHQFEHKYWLFSYPARRGESGRHVDAVHAFDEALDVNAVARAISESTTRRAWDTCHGLIYFLKVVFPRKAAAIVRKLDIDKLDLATEQYWSEMPEELATLLWAISQAGGKSIVESWIARHAKEISHLNIMLLRTAPQVIAELVRAGASFGTSNNPWVSVSTIVPMLAKVDADIARQVAERHCKAIAYTFANAPIYGNKDEAVLLATLDKLSPGLLTKAVGMITNLDSAEHQWAAVLREGDSLGRKIVRDILRAAAATQSPASDIANRLLAQPPKRRRTK